MRSAVLTGLLVALATSACGGAVGSHATPAHGGVVSFSDQAVGLAGEYPAGWHYARGITRFVDPREVMTIASYPLRGSAEAGECAPDTAREDIPTDGTFIWLLEYRPPRGDPWADLPRSRFPVKPTRFELAAGDFSEEHISCFDGPGYGTTFRAADRPFQLLVAFGEEPTREQRAQVNAILNSLRFDELPALPPDPYAGWPLVNDNPGDSLRPPPGWPAAAAMFAPETTPRPRVLFFASNRPLDGLPAKLVRHVDTLPGPYPERAVVNLPADGVLVWVLEERKDSPLARFPPLDTRWPQRDDFEAAEVLTEPAPDVRWLRATASYRTYRFSVWIGWGPQATTEDRELALKSAASLALSGCARDSLDDCPSS